MKALWEMTRRQQIAYWGDQWAKYRDNAADTTAAIDKTEDPARRARLAAIADGQLGAVQECAVALAELGAVFKNGKWTLGPVDPRTFLPAIREHAIRNYEDGWDVVAEAMTDAEILAQVKWCESPAGAIRKLGRMVRNYAAYAAEIRATAF